MTWINNYSSVLTKKYKLENTNITENFITRYKKYNHRAEFRFKSVDVNNTFVSFSYYDRNDWEKTTQLTVILNKALGDNVKIRNEWCSLFVYFTDIDEFFKALPKKFRGGLVSLEIMNKDIVKAKDDYTSDFQIDLTVRKHLPYKSYRYRVWLVSNSRERKRIGSENIKNMSESILNYDGIHVNAREIFQRLIHGRWYCQNLYFYTKTIDFLPMIALMDPRFIKRIEHFKTDKEIKNEYTS